MKWDDGKEYPVVKIEVSSESHPFYTGKQKIVDTAGRVEKFKRRYTKKPRKPKSPGAMLPRLQLPPSAAALAADRARLRAARPRRPRPVEVARRHRHRHRARHGADRRAGCVPRVAGCGLAVRPAALPLGRARPSARLLQVAASSSTPAARLASGALRARGASGSSTARRATGATTQIERRITAAAALLLLLGSVGLMVHAHEAVPELAALAALCGALAALPHAAAPAARRRRCCSARRSASRFLSAELGRAASALALAVVAAHLACPAVAHAPRACCSSPSAAAGRAACSAARWPLALALRSPELSSQWWMRRLAARRAASAATCATSSPPASWFAWPAWPLALWAAWSLRRRLARAAPVRAAAPRVLLMLAGARWSGARAQDVNADPAARAARAARRARRRTRCGAARPRRSTGSACVTFAFFAGAGVAGLRRDDDRRAAAHREQLRQDRARLRRRSSSWLPFLRRAGAHAGLALSRVLHARPRRLRSVARWAAGIVLLWGTFAMLWMPWADYQKSYRSVALQLRSKIPADARLHRAARTSACRRRAALDYHAGIRAARASIARGPTPARCCSCRAAAQHEFDAPGAGLGQARRRRPARRQGRALPPLPPRRNEHPPAHASATPGRSSPHHAESLARRAPARALRQRRRARARSSSPRRPACATTTRASASARSRCACSPASPRERGFAAVARGAASPASRSTPPRSRAAWHTALRAGDAAPPEVQATRSPA